MKLTHEEIRFLSKIRVEDDCWIWTASTNGKGNYGHLGVAGRKTMTAHRFSYEHFVGPVPEGMFGLHRCDKTLCVNPEHLFTGTDEDNKHDMVDKRRQRDLTIRFADGKFAPYKKGTKCRSSLAKKTSKH